MAVGQQGADRRVDEVCELDLHRGPAGGERPLDLVEGGCGRDAVETEPRDLVEGRSFFGEARHATGNRDHETRGVRLPATGGLAAPGYQLGLGPLDARCQVGVAEQRRSFRRSCRDCLHLSGSPRRSGGIPMCLGRTCMGNARWVTKAYRRRLRGASTAVPDVIVR